MENSGMNFLKDNDTIFRSALISPIIKILPAHTELPATGAEMV